MTEASRVQKMLNEQNAWIDQLKSQVMRLELELVGYRVRNKQLEAALRDVTIAWDKWQKICDSNSFTELFVSICEAKALEEKDESTR